MKRLLLNLLLVLLFSAKAFSQADIYEELNGAFNASDQKNIAKYFNNKVELTIIEQSSVYSKTQAEMVLRDFFVKYPPTSFQFKHKGSSGEGARFAIGFLNTRNGNFRIYFFMKQIDNVNYLQEMRFELDPSSSRN